MDFNLDELEGQYTERSQVTEATAKPTVRTDSYDLDIKSVTLKVSDHEKSPTKGRKLIQLQVHGMEGNAHFTMFPEASWETYRVKQVGDEFVRLKPGDELYSEDLPMDKPSKLWAQLEGVFNSDGSMSIKELIKALPGSKVNAYVLEGYYPADGGRPEWNPAKKNQYGSPEDYLKAYDDNRREFLKAGLIPKNSVSNFRKVKEG